MKELILKIVDTLIAASAQGIKEEVMRDLISRILLRLSEELSVEQYTQAVQQLSVSLPPEIAGLITAAEVQADYLAVQEEFAEVIRDAVILQREEQIGTVRKGAKGLAVKVAVDETMLEIARGYSGAFITFLVRPIDATKFLAYLPKKMKAASIRALQKLGQNSRSEIKQMAIQNIKRSFKEKATLPDDISLPISLQGLAGHPWPSLSDKYMENKRKMVSGKERVPAKHYVRRKTGRSYYREKKRLARYLEMGKLTGRMYEALTRGRFGFRVRNTDLGFFIGFEMPETKVGDVASYASTFFWGVKRPTGSQPPRPWTYFTKQDAETLVRAGLRFLENEVKEGLLFELGFGAKTVWSSRTKVRNKQRSMFFSTIVR